MQIEHREKLGLNICIITPQYGHFWSGLGTYATNLINALVERGHKVAVICPEAVKEKVHQKVRLIEMPEKGFRPTLGNWFFVSYYFNKTLKNLLEKESFDIIHFADARDSFFCKIKDTPVIGTMHDYYFAEAPKPPFLYRRYYKDWLKRWLFYNFTRFMERRAIKRLSFVLTNTDYVKEVLIRKYKLGSDVLRTINYGIQLNLTRREIEGLKGIPSILFVGANFQRKGLPTLIRAIADVIRRYPAVSLHVVGKDAKEREMRELSRELGVEENVYFLGWMDNEELKGLFKKADIFAMPSLIEGFGLVFLEAMDVGTPVIGGDTGGTPELIKNGQNGFLIKPGDWQALSEKIQRLAENKELRERFIKEGFRTLERFSVDRMVEETIEIYTRLI